MKLKTLYLENFGPFREYEIVFPTEATSCVLITGINNAGKTTIIRALKLVGSALNFARSSTKPFTKQLYKKDIQDIDISHMMYQFKAQEAIVQATFDNEKTIKLLLNSFDDSVTCDIPPYTHASMSKLFGFLPPLGQLAEGETLLTERHLLKHIGSALAPHHLRNHLYHFFTPEQYLYVKELLRDSWEGVELQECRYDIPSGLLTCTYREGEFYNEIAWAGQGLQIWLQIIAHLVRLLQYPILVLDEPEIFLHPGKQHDLIQLLQDHYTGCAIIATHSPELMNDVDISHILHVNKESSRSILRKTSDRDSLEKIRNNIGSSFNFHTSQFEDIDSLLFTEHHLDYNIIRKFSSHLNITKKTQNIKISGFSRWKDYIHYRDAYHTYFNKYVECSMLLDRDYYPDDYLDSIRETLLAANVTIAFTPGKEIENLFLDEDFLITLLPNGANPSDLHNFLDQTYDNKYETCKSKYAEFSKDYSDLNRGKTYTTVLNEISPIFNMIWNDKVQRHKLVPGKETLAEVRDFFRVNYHINLTTSFLSAELCLKRKVFVKEFLSKIL